MDLQLTNPTNLLTLVLAGSVLIFAVFAIAITRRRQLRQRLMHLEGGEPRPSQLPRESHREAVDRLIKALEDQD